MIGLLDMYIDNMDDLNILESLNIYEKRFINGLENTKDKLDNYPELIAIFKDLAKQRHLLVTKSLIINKFIKKQLINN
ncbi:MAG: hypothetical protein OEY79_03825 [Anaplasmataceae bacterium]|nr:hypothetical protein [Anaplasmataceae bacterium]